MSTYREAKIRSVLESGEYFDDWSEHGTDQSTAWCQPLRMVQTLDATHLFFGDPHDCALCGEPSGHFVNRDGRTRCATCDEAYCAACLRSSLVTTEGGKMMTPVRLVRSIETLVAKEFACVWPEVAVSAENVFNIRGEIDRYLDNLWHELDRAELRALQSQREQEAEAAEQTKMEGLNADKL